jgi:hypothetical protein
MDCDMPLHFEGMSHISRVRFVYLELRIPLLDAARSDALGSHPNNFGKPRAPDFCNVFISF